MKKILFVFLLFCVLQPGSAQTASGVVSGTISGAPPAGIDVRISMYDPGMTVVVFRDTVTTNLTGYYESSYSFPTPPAKGIVWVDFSDCFSTINSDSAGWNNLTTNPVLDFNYCDFSSCTAIFSHVNTGLTVNFTSFSGSIAPDSLDYFWRFGDGNTSTEKHPVHTFSVPGTYTVCLSLYDSVLVCTSSFCEVVTLVNPSSGITLSGRVTASGSRPGLAMVYLFRASTNGSFTLQDSMQISDLETGEYIFDVTAGTYCVNAVLSPFNPDYDRYFPTYYKNSLSWTTSTGIVVTTENSFGNDIPLLEGMSTSGPGFIGGKVSWEMGSPCTGALVILMNESGEGIVHTLSDGEGNYRFPDLSYGVYEIFVEIVAKTAYHRIVELSPGHEREENADFIVRDAYITTGVAEMEKVEASGIYPNPASDRIQLAIVAKQALSATLFISDPTGRQMMERSLSLQAGQQFLEISIAHLPKGVYLLHLSTAEVHITRRVAKF